MAFRPPKKDPQFADLKGILAQTKDTESPLYQTIQILIERLDQLRINIAEKMAGIDNGSILSNVANKFATYLTKENETVVLPNSWQLLAGTGVTFDDSVPNKRTINAAGGSNHYDSPLSDGDLVAADLIFADGECIIVQVPV